MREAEAQRGKKASSRGEETERESRSWKARARVTGAQRRAAEERKLKRKKLGGDRSVKRKKTSRGTKGFRYKKKQRVSTIVSMTSITYELLAMFLLHVSLYKI